MPILVCRTYFSSSKLKNSWNLFKKPNERCIFTIFSQNWPT